MQKNQNSAPLLLDCTLRDGGYVNEWDFDMEFACRLYQALSAAGIDYIELGFINPSYTGRNPWLNVNAETIADVKGEKPGARIAVMINFGKVTAWEIPDSDALPVDLVRIAVPKTDRAQACKLARELNQKGYRTTVNFMGISNYNNSEILDLVHLMNEYRESVRFFYLVDSFGSLVPGRIRDIFNSLRFGTSGPIGYHSHNNLQMAFANSLAAIHAGVEIIDGSILGMGRGGGNLFLETVLAYLEQVYPEKYKLLPVLMFADLKMREVQNRYQWGYSFEQLLSGVMGCHPNYPINLLKNKNTTADDVYHILKSIPPEKKNRFNEQLCKNLYRKHLFEKVQNINTIKTEGINEALKKSDGRALIICGGSSIANCRNQLAHYIGEHQLAVISVNRPNDLFHLDAVFFGNRRRFLGYQHVIPDDAEIVFSPTIDEALAENMQPEFSRPSLEFVNRLEEMDYLPTNSGIMAIYTLFALGFRDFLLAGFDGYEEKKPLYYYNESDIVEDSSNRKHLNEVARRELKRAHTLFLKLDAAFKIVTPTIFTEYYDPSLLENIQ